MKLSHMINSRTEVVSERGVAAGGHEKEAEAGVRMLEAGGNAIDAVVAAAFTGYVVEPASCGLGGYGRLSIFLAERQEFITIDHYVRGPGKSHPTLFEIDTSAPMFYYGHPQTVGGQSDWGYLAAAVPGAVSGLCAAHKMFGKLPLAQVLEPAIEAAEAGLQVSWSLVQNIATRINEIRQLPHAAALLLRNGELPRPVSPWSQGDRLDQSELAQTLRLIAQHGAAGFYSGPVAEAIEREFAAHGGILTAADLANYQPRILREKPSRYRGYDYITAYDQVTYEALNILDHFNLASHGPDSLTYRHLVAEALAQAFVDNMTHYGDPEYVKSPVNGLASRAFADERAAAINLERAAARPITAADPWPFETDAEAPEVLPSGPTIASPKGTSQMAAADQAGNMATLITSLTSGFGSVVLVPGTGVFLNNSMRNFDPRPNLPNSLAPGKMPIFAAPSLVAARDGKAVFGGCGSGGYRILSGVVHALMHVVDFDMGIQAAIDHPRVHCQGDQTYVDSRIPDDVVRGLEALGHSVVVQEENPGATNFGRINGIYIDPKTGLLHAGSGPAWTSAAAGV